MPRQNGASSRNIRTLSVSSGDKYQNGSVTTPRVITPQIHVLCKSISEYEPVFVPVVAEPGNLINECFHNVYAYIEKHGGQKILGCSIWQSANVLIEAEAHAVWKSPSGNMVDVTPHSNNETSILFSVDHQDI